MGERENGDALALERRPWVRMTERMMKVFIVWFERVEEGAS